MYKEYNYLCRMDITKVLLCIFEADKFEMDDMMDQKTV